MGDEIVVPAVNAKTRVVVVGVVLVGAPVGTDLDPAEVEVTLTHLPTGEVITPVVKNSMAGPSIAARFLPLKKGTYAANATSRDDGGAVSHTATPVEVDTIQGQKEIKVELTRAPELQLVRAEFLGDHGLLRPTPKSEAFTRDGNQITSRFGDATEAASALKPQYQAANESQHEGVSDAVWHPASYSRGQTVSLRLTLRPTLEGSGSHTLTEFSLVSTTSDAVTREALSFRDQQPQSLSDNTELTLDLPAAAALPDVIEHLEEMLVAEARVNGLPARIERRHHRSSIYVTWGTPTGQVEMHQSIAAKVPFPESGAIQSITEERLRWAVAAARNASSEREAMVRIHEHLVTAGIEFFGGRFYPVKDAANTTQIVPKPELHPFLWIALNVPETAQCLDLAGAMRLPARILGIEGAMPVRTIFPWPPWDPNTGDRRPLNNQAKQPAQGSLKNPFVHDGARCVFFDRAGFLNNFEGVLSWTPVGETHATLFAIGVRICDAHALDPNLPADEIQERNASLFFQPFKNDVSQGEFKLAMVQDGQLRRPAFGFLDNQNQTLFEFHYIKSTFEKGDDRKITGLRLEEQKP